MRYHKASKARYLESLRYLTMGYWKMALPLTLRKGNHQPLVDPPHERTMIQCFDGLLVFNLTSLLNNHSSGRSFQMPWCSHVSEMHQCNGVGDMNNTGKKIQRMCCSITWSCTAFYYNIFWWFTAKIKIVKWHVHILPWRMQCMIRQWWENHFHINAPLCWGVPRYRWIPSIQGPWR